MYGSNFYVSDVNRQENAQLFSESSLDKQVLNNHCFQYTAKSEISDVFEKKHNGVNPFHDHDRKWRKRKIEREESRNSFIMGIQEKNSFA